MMLTARFRNRPRAPAACGRRTGRAARLPTAALLLAIPTIGVPPAAAVTWPMAPDKQVIGELTTDTLRPGDRLVDMARMHNIGFVEMRAANPGLDPWLPKAGERITVPQLHVLPEGEREGIVINLSERRLYYFAASWPDREGPVVSTHPVGVGLAERATPLTRTRVTARVEDPAWYPTEPVRDWYRRVRDIDLPAVVPPGPDNPLGRHALILEGDGLLIHGTHRPAGVGMRVSQGCIRLYPESIANLIRQVPVGTPVRIVDQPARLGWRRDRLYAEIDPPGDAADDRHGDGIWRQLLADASARAGARDAVVDRTALREAFRRADGIPVVVAEIPGAPPRTSGRDENAGSAPGVDEIR
jgi:L,D-transpeptidase ErfK/SrfK